jgi:uncharacterized protein
VEPKITSITLSVNDLEKSVAFYRDGLGFPSEGIVSTSDAPGDEGRIALFMLSGGLILSLYPKSDLAKDSKLSMASSSPLEFSLMHQVASKEEVDAVMRQAKEAGANITDLPHDRGGVYSGFFQDLDGHLWEIVSTTL